MPQVLCVLCLWGSTAACWSMIVLRRRLCWQRVRRSRSEVGRSRLSWVTMMRGRTIRGGGRRYSKVSSLRLASLTFLPHPANASDIPECLLDAAIPVKVTPGKLWKAVRWIEEQCKQKQCVVWGDKKLRSQWFAVR